MGIARIDPSLEATHVTARVRTRPLGQPERRFVDLDVALVPLRCAACGTQLPGFYEHRGSRYGQVGSVGCSCGAVVGVTDADNVVASRR